jgi:hypothetical protein
MIATETVVLCASCGGRLARDHSGTVCSPCQRTLIERSARRHVLIAREGPGIKTAFETSGLYGVAQYLECTPDEALDVVISSRLFPFMSERRRRLLHQLVNLRNSSHVAVAEELHISRWTVAAYRHQLGIDRVPASVNGRQR